MSSHRRNPSWDDYPDPWNLAKAFVG
jgi:hypothetical protein